MIRITFKNSKKLFSFIRYNYQILSMFKIKEMYMESEDGELNNYNIEINDIDKVEEDLLDLNNNEINLAFEKVEKAVNKNIQRGLLLDLWLKLPKELKNNYDPDDEYKELYFRIYDSDEVIMIKTIEVKNSMESSFMPTQKFDTYLFQLYTEWQNNI